ncbi:uncharacterized protein CXorf58 homolog [Ursus arctos]|uniref:uncharacterized protein CXorf58 homolog n=1 Tax=Ursus arctos TaxID=9644 RepID=UPI002547DC05|nr:uncharacterized protein CXorf58 homolog [Ursus arctos]
MDRTIFKLLKHTICAVERCVTHEILKKVSPLEAELLKDPSMKCKVRFRFSGETFPPFIVFKIFLHTEGHGYKYFSGKNLFKPSSEGVADACKMMGKKKFYHQVMEDQHLFQKFKITDEIDIVTLKDYMQYSSVLDETPASSGGRNNYWRKLNLKNIPRTMMIYDIVDYAESGIISKRLQKEMKYLLQRPRTEEMLQIVSEVR